MPPSSVIFFALLAAVSLGVKGGVFLGLDPPQAFGSGQPAIAAFLEKNGYGVSVDPDDTLAWVEGRKGDCTLNVAEVSPDGWFSDIVAQQALGQRLAYVFDGGFYDEQPAIATKLANYRARLLGYLRLPAEPVRVRAVRASRGCPPDVFSDALARGLS